MRVDLWNHFYIINLEQMWPKLITCKVLGYDIIVTILYVLGTFVVCFLRLGSSYALICRLYLPVIARY